MSLHGRETDRDRIAADLRGGRSVVILGGAGIGKTELWRGVLEALQKQGTPVCRVVATATTRLIPGGVFAGLIAHAAPSRSASDRIVATLRALAAEGETAVICVDDAHLLDDESAAAILQHALSGGRLLLTARTGEPAPDAVRRFWKDGIASVWNVGPLDAEASAALVEEQVGAPVERLTQARLYAASGGNPLLLRELVEHGRVTGALCDLGGVWSWKGDLEAPPNVAAVIRERLIGIDPAVREVAELLAVGGPLPRVLFERLVVGPAFAAARRAGILRDRAHGPGEVLDLAHPLYAPVLIESLPAERERALLERLVAVAEPLAAGDRDLEVLLAAWFVRLADRSHPELLVAAAQRAFQRGELALAAPLARAAVAAGGGVSADRIMARIQAFLGEPAVAPAQEQAPEDERAILESAMARADGFLVGIGTREAALVALADAQRRIGGSYRLEAAAHALGIRVYAGEPIAPLLGELEPMLAEAAPRKVIARAAMAAAPALTVAGRPLDAIAALDRGIAAADASGRFSPYLRERLVSTRVQCLLFAGRIEEALATASLQHAEADAAGDVPALGVWSQVLAQALLWQGRPHEAMRRFGESLSLTRGIDVVGYAAWCQADLAHCLSWTAAVGAEAKLPIVPAPGSHGALVAPLIELAIAARSLCLGETGDAERHATSAARRAAEGGQTMSELLAEHFLLRLRPTRALASRVEALGARCQGTYATALARSAAAMASGRGADLERAAAHFADLGVVPLAAEWFARASLAFRDAGAASAARRAGSLAQEQRARMDARSAAARAGARRRRSSDAARARGRGARLARSHQSRDRAAADRFGAHRARSSPDGLRQARRQRSTATRRAARGPHFGRPPAGVMPRQGGAEDIETPLAQAPIR